MPNTGLFHLQQIVPIAFFHWQQNVPTTFLCISWDILSPGRKWDILSSWDNFSPKKCRTGRRETMAFYECNSGTFCRRGENGSTRFLRDTFGHIWWRGALKHFDGPRYWPSNWQSGTTDKMSQQPSNNFPVLQCISWDILSPREKVGHFVIWDNLSPRNCQWDHCFLMDMPDIWPKIAQGISKISPRYAQALPKVWWFKLTKWDKMSPGRVH